MRTALLICLAAVPIFIGIWCVASVIFLAYAIWGNPYAEASPDIAKGTALLPRFKDEIAQFWAHSLGYMFWCGLVLNILFAYMLIQFGLISWLTEFFEIEKTQYPCCSPKEITVHYIIWTVNSLAWIIGFKYMSWSLKKLQSHCSKRYMLHSVMSLYVAHWSLLVGGIAGLVVMLALVIKRFW